MDNAELRALTNNYKPGPETVEALRDITLIALVGPTAAGKTTLIKYLIDNDPSIHRVVSDTSRPPRPDETQGVDFNFRTKEEMLTDIQKGVYVQAVYSFSESFYGTRADSYGKSGSAVIAIRASVVPIFRSLPFKGVKVVCVVPPDFESWQQRMQSHHFKQVDIAERMREAKESLSFAYNDPEAQLLMNEDLQFASQMFLDIVNDKPLSVDQLGNQRQAKFAIDDILSA